MNFIKKVYNKTQTTYYLKCHEKILQTKNVNAEKTKNVSAMKKMENIPKNT